MPWVLFVRNFNFEVTPSVTIAYRAGMTEFVHQTCADKAIALDRGTIVRRPPGRKSRKGKGNGAA